MKLCVDQHHPASDRSIMNSYISSAARTDRSSEPSGYVSTGRAAGIPTGYVSPATRTGAGSYVSSDWVTAA
jgi:hypothetical protein